MARILVGVWLAVLVWAGGAWADEYLTVKAGELKSNPQNYWARGVSFSDQLEGLAGEKGIKLGGRMHHAFATRTVGTCYVEEGLRDQLNGLQPGREYVFTGTVYQRNKGWFSSERRFFVAVNRIVPAAQETEKALTDLRDSFGRTSLSGPHADALRALNDILTDAQTELAAYCASSNLEVKALFQAGPEGLHVVSQAVRQAMIRRENQTKTPSLEYFVSLLTALVAWRNLLQLPRLQPLRMRP